MSDTSVSISFGGQTSDFEVACQRALASMKALTDGVSTLTANLAAATAGLNTTTPAMNTAAAATAGAATAMKTVAPAAQDAAQSLEKVAVTQATAGASATNLGAAIGTSTSALHAATSATKNHGAAPEAMVLVHEAMSGRFSRMGGSLMILTQRLGGASMAMMALAGAFGVAAMGAMHAIEWFDKLSAAKLLATAGGVGSGIANKDLEAQLDKVKRIKDATTEAAGQVVHALDTLPGMTLPVLDQMTSTMHTLALRMGEDLPAAAKKVGDAWNLNATAGADLLNKTRASTEAVQAYARAAQEGDAIQARTILLKEMARSEAEVVKGTRLSTEVNSDAAAKAKLLRDMGAGGRAMGGASTAEDTAAQAVTLAESAANADRLAAALGNVSATVKGAEVTTWSQRVDADLQKAVFGTEQAAHQQGANWQHIHEAMADTTVKFWQNEVGQTTAGTKNREEAERKLMAALEAQDMAKLRFDTVNGQKSVQEHIAELSAEQAANRDDYTKWMAIEAQKLTVLRNAYGEKSKQYQAELRAEETYQREHQAKLEALELEHITKDEAIRQKQLQETLNGLAAEVAAQQMNKSEELTWRARRLRPRGCWSP